LNARVFAQPGPFPDLRPGGRNRYSFGKRCRSALGGADRPCYRVRRQACAIGESGHSAALVHAGLDPNMQAVRNLLRHGAAVRMAECGVSIGCPISRPYEFEGRYRVCARFSPSYLERAASALE